MKYPIFWVLVVFLLFLSLGANYVQKNGTSLVVKELTKEDRKVVRHEILQQLINKYESNQTFAKVHEYMIKKYQELHKSDPPEDPGLVIQETLDRARLLFDRTKVFVGNTFVRVYDPVQIENNVHKYLWLKGLCFLVLGIGDEHRIALSYFYLPGNENIKKDFLKDVVLYSFPEVPDVPENNEWQEDMMAVMDRLGFKIFNVDKFLTNN